MSLPSQIIAHESFGQILSNAYAEPKPVIKPKVPKIPKRTLTTRPPIVWFPGEPECNETATPSFSNTFQLIAFLLSVFNIASAMVANANNNNNNNNINDNKLNGNENDVNEGNANSQVMAMNMIMPGRDLPFPVQAQFVGDQVHFVEKRSLNQDGKIANAIMSFAQLWMQLQVAATKDCQRLHFCKTNEEVSRQGRYQWEISEICSLKITSKLVKNQHDAKELLLAGQYGRLGLNCTAIYDDCGLNEKRFIEHSRLMPWSPMGELKKIRNLVTWILSK